VFIKNSTAKAHQIGKVKLNFRDFVFHDASLVHPVTFVNKATGFEAGTAFIRLTYQPLEPLTLLNPNWQTKLKSAEQAKDKFEFFNDQLQN
jgi:hypothetical protein